MALLRILVVEDDAVIATLIADTLEVMGHSVCAIAQTESEAVAAAMAQRPDLMIVDEHLSEGTGRRAIRRIERDGPVPHIFMTGDTASALEGDTPGATTLRKPFQDQDLARAIERVLDRDRAA